MDTTFKVVPKNLRPYKLLVLVGLPKTLTFPIILRFILINFLDTIAHEKLFNYLNDNFNFKPSIIHTDFEKALQTSIKNNKITKDAIHTK